MFLSTQHNETRYLPHKSHQFYHLRCPLPTIFGFLGIRPESITHSHRPKHTYSGRDQVLILARECHAFGHFNRPHHVYPARHGLRPQLVRSRLALLVRQRKQGVPAVARRHRRCHTEDRGCARRAAWYCSGCSGRRGGQTCDAVW